MFSTDVTAYRSIMADFLSDVLLAMRRLRRSRKRRTCSGWTRTTKHGLEWNWTENSHKILVKNLTCLVDTS